MLIGSLSLLHLLSLDHRTVPTFCFSGFQFKNGYTKKRIVSIGYLCTVVKMMILQTTITTASTEHSSDNTLVQVCCFCTLTFVQDCRRGHMTAVIAVYAVYYCLLLFSLRLWSFGVDDWRQCDSGDG